MPTTSPIYSTTPVVEPVSLALAKVHLRLDVDLDSVDEAAQAERDYVNLLLRAARAACEGFTGGYYAGGQTVDYTFRLDEDYVLPVGSTVTAVRGFFTDVASLQTWNWEEYRKGSSVNREWDLPYAASQTYTVTVELPVSVTDQCPPPVKLAILELAAEWYRNRETSGNVGRELPVSYRVKLAPLVVKPVLF